MLKKVWVLKYLKKNKKTLLYNGHNFLCEDFVESEVKSGRKSEIKSERLSKPKFLEQKIFVKV